MDVKYKLVYLKNNEEFILDNASTLVGRSESCPVRVESDNLSREHARILIREDKVLVQDLHSTNGTFVNHKRISEATELTPGCTVQFGEESFSLQLIDDEVTIVAVPKSKNKRTEASIVEEDEEEDSTVLFQAYQLPPGWHNVDMDSTNFDSQDSEAKKRAIEAYVKKTSIGFKGAKGLILFFFVEDEPPSIRMVSLKDDSPREWSFGRTEDNDVIFRHQSISEKHARLKYTVSSWTLEDTESTNGIWLNNKRLESIELRDDLHFHVGSVEVLARFINH